MKKIKVTTKLVSFFLAFLILFYSIPAIVYAESADAISSLFDSEEIEKTSSEAKEKIERAYEVEELRTENTKTFKIEGGAFYAAQYPTSVHRMNENGEWEDINNTLNQSGSEYTTSDARIKFAKKITGNSSIFTLHENNKKITLALEGANKKTAAKMPQLFVCVNFCTCSTTSTNRSFTKNCGKSDTLNAGLLTCALRRMYLAFPIPQ